MVSLNAVLLVTSLANSGPGTLRDQIAAALPGDEIQFSGVAGTITLNSAITIGKTLFINGPGAGKIVVSANNNDRVFVTGGNPVFISGITVADGLVAGADGVDGTISQNGTAGSPAFGGAILNVYNSDRLILSNCWFHNNTARGGHGGRGGDNGPLITPGNGGNGGYADGGALYATGEVLIVNCTFSGNRAIGGKGGDGGKNNNLSSVPGGTGGTGGGGAAGAVEITSATKTPDLASSTFSGNSAIGGDGGKGGDSDLARPGGQGGNGAGANCGAISVFEMSLYNSTIVSNSAIGGAAGAGGSGVPIGAAGSAGTGSGGGICTYMIVCLPKLGNTILADNFADGCCSNYTARFNDDGYNFVGSEDFPICNSQASTQKGTVTSPLHPDLKPLIQGGSGLPTHATHPGSPVTDKGYSFGYLTDERGAPRATDLNFISNTGDGTDIGAFELGNPEVGLGVISNNVVVISWPGYYGEFLLQSSVNLANSNSWSAVTDAVAEVNGNFVMTNAITGTNRFYRLISR